MSPPQRMRADDKTQGAPVRQMQQFLLRLDERGEQRALVFLEGAEIGVFGQAAPLAQSFQQFVHGRRRGEPIVFELPELGEGGVEEREPRVGAVDRDRHRDVLQHLGMGGGVAGEFAAQGFGIGQIAREAHQLAAFLERHLGDLEHLARAFDHDMAALALGRALVARALRQCPAFGCRQFQPLVERLGRLGIDRGGIGAVDLDQRQIVGTAAPHRDGQRIEDGAQGCPLAFGGFGARQQRRALLFAVAQARGEPVAFAFQGFGPDAMRAPEPPESPQRGQRQQRQSGDRKRLRQDEIGDVGPPAARLGTPSRIGGILGKCVEIVEQAGDAAVIELIHDGAGALHRRSQVEAADALLDAGDIGRRHRQVADAEAEQAARYSADRPPFRRTG